MDTLLGLVVLVIMMLIVYFVGKLANNLWLHDNTFPSVILGFFVFFIALMIVLIAIVIYSAATILGQLILSIL